jgi:hypothetical protein
MEDDRNRGGQSKFSTLQKLSAGVTVVGALTGGHFSLGKEFLKSIVEASAAASEARPQLPRSCTYEILKENEGVTVVRVETDPPNVGSIASRVAVCYAGQFREQAYQQPGSEIRIDTVRQISGVTVSISMMPESATSEQQVASSFTPRMFCRQG